MRIRATSDEFDRGNALGRAVISRRRFLRGLAGVGAAIPLASLLAACGGDDDDDNESAATSTPEDDIETDGEPTATTVDTGDAGGTRTVTHAMGTTEVPAEPQRVVVLDMGEMDMALALGVQPVGAALYTIDQEFASYLQEEIGEYTRVGTVSEPDLEAVAALDPDLIISNMTRHEDIYETLSQIAPTVLAESLGADWKASFELVAEALGKSAEHEQVMADYVARIEEFQTAMGDRLEQTHVTVVRSMPDQLRLYMKDSFIGRVLEDSGLPRPPVQDQEIFMEEISAERIRDLAADVIFTLYYNPSQGETLSPLLENPLWEQLEAVQAGQVYEMDDEVWGTGLGPLAAMQVIADLTTVLVEGDVDASVWSPSEAQAGAGGGGGSRTIEHKYGSTEISGLPERVVSVGYNEQDTLLALGVKPLAVRYWYGDEPYSVFPWAQDELGDAEPVVLGEGGELDFEAVAALDPDLIVGVYSGMTEEEYNTLSQIAPTVPQSGEYIDYGMPWQEVTVLVGRALGREAEAEALVQEVEGQFERARSAHPEWEGLNAVIGAPDGTGQFGFVASQDPRSRVLQALGFVVPKEFDEIAGDQFYGSISLERADLLEQDLIVFFQLDWVEGGREAIESDPLLSRLDAVQEGRAVYLAGELDSALAFNSVLSLPHFLEAFIPMLEGAMDGDPETDSSA